MQKKAKDVKPDDRIMIGGALYEVHKVTKNDMDGRVLDLQHLDTKTYGHMLIVNSDCEVETVQ